MDFAEMENIISQGHSDKQAINDHTLQSMMLKNQKLEHKIKDIETVKRENVELKAAREKHQAEFNALWEDKQRLYEEIIPLKE